MSRRRKKPAAQRSPERSGVKFWGREGSLDPARLITPSADPTAMVRSLGAPPLGVLAGPGEHYLSAAYDKAAGVAVALAAAGDLLDLEALHPPGS
jgi:hypothetical protein